MKTDELEIRSCETFLAHANPQEAAAVAFAAILRLGELELEEPADDVPEGAPGRALAMLLPPPDDTEFRPQWDEGVNLILDVDQGDYDV